MFSRRHFLGLLAATSSTSYFCAPVIAAALEEQKAEDSLFTPAAKKAVDSGLKFLLDGQAKDGSFGTRNFAGNVGITSLCGLALLCGEHQPGVGAEGKSLDRALDYVLAQEDANTPGYLHTLKGTPHGPMYNHGYAVLFLASAHGKVKVAGRRTKLDAVLKRAVKLSLSSQNAEGGWRYIPTSPDSDLTVTSVQLCSLRAARDAGCGVPKTTLSKAVAYIKKCQDPEGSFRYMARGGKGNWVRTAAGLVALLSAGVTRGKEIERANAYLLKNPPDPKAKPDMAFHFGHFYASLATCAIGGETMKKWYVPARDALIARQDKNEGKWSDIICAHSATAMAVLALTAPKGMLTPEF